MLTPQTQNTKDGTFKDENTKYKSWHPQTQKHPQRKMSRGKAGTSTTSSATPVLFPWQAKIMLLRWNSHHHHHRPDHQHHQHRDHH